MHVLFYFTKLLLIHKYVFTSLNGTNGDDLYIRLATVGNTIQAVNSPMYDTYMSTPGITAKLGATHSNIQTTQSSPSLVVLY